MLLQIQIRLNKPSQLLRTLTPPRSDVAECSTQIVLLCQIGLRRKTSQCHPSLPSINAKAANVQSREIGSKQTENSSIAVASNVVRVERRSKVRFLSRRLRAHLCAEPAWPPLSKMKSTRKLSKRRNQLHRPAVAPFRRLQARHPRVSEDMKRSACLAKSRFQKENGSTRLEKTGMCGVSCVSDVEHNSQSGSSLPMLTNLCARPVRNSCYDRGKTQ